MNADAAHIWIMTGARVAHRSEPSIYTFDIIAGELEPHVALVAERTADLPYFAAAEIARDFGKRFATDIITHGEVNADALLTEVMK